MFGVVLMMRKQAQGRGLREYSPHTRGRVTAAPGPFIIS